MIKPASVGSDGAVPSLAAFEGAWGIVRDIRDGLSGEVLQFEGTGRFAPEAGGLRYSEAGKLVLPRGGTVRAERSYIFREGTDGIEVLFHDGRPFHCIPRGVDAPVAAHWCDPDSYEVAYDFRTWPEWTTRWRVTGPRKDYRMVTRYRPACPRGDRTSRLRQ